MSSPLSPSRSTIITSADDPVVPVADFRHLPGNRYLDLDIQPYGGHCGFLDPFPFGCWYERRIAETIDKRKPDERAPADPGLFTDEVGFPARVVDKLGAHDCDFREIFQGILEDRGTDRRRVAGVLLPLRLSRGPPRRKGTVRISIGQTVADRAAAGRL